MHYKTVSMKELRGKKIVKVKSGVFEELGMVFKPYQAYTLFTETGEQYILWNSHGEQYLSQVFKD